MCVLIKLGFSSNSNLFITCFLIFMLHFSPQIFTFSDSYNRSINSLLLLLKLLTVNLNLINFDYFFYWVDFRSSHFSYGFSKQD